MADPLPSPPPPAARAPSRPVRRFRPGYTLVETMVVIVIVGIMFAYMQPKLRQFRDKSNMRAARDQVSSMVAAARAAAIQKGRNAQLWVNVGGTYNQMSVTVDTNATPLRMQVIFPRAFDALYYVTLTTANTADSMITFSSRGMGSTGSGGTAVIRLTGAAGSDSICISRYGMVEKRGCF